MSVGLLGYVGVGVESSGGTTSTSGATPVAEYVPYISETFAVTRTDLPDPSLSTQWDERRMYNGQQQIGGTIQMQVHPSAIGYFFRSWFDTTTFMPASSWLVTSNANFGAHRFLAAATTQFQSGSGADVPLLSFEVYRGPLPYNVTAPSSAFFYYNCAANVMEVSLDAGGMLRSSFDFIGRDYARKASTTPTYTPPDAFLWSTISLTTGGAGSTIFQSIRLRGNNNLDGIAKLDGRLRPDLIKRQNFRTVEISGRLTFQSDSDYDLFTNGSETLFRASMRATQTSFQILIEAPRFRYSTFPLGATGPGPLTVDFTGRAMYDAGSGTSLSITLVNTRLNGYYVNSNT